MKIRIFTQEELSSIFFPKAFWRELENFYDVPKQDIENFKNKDALAVYALQLEQYQHGLVRFINETMKRLPNKQGVDFYSIAEDILTEEVNNHVKVLAERCRGNIVSYFEQKYKKMNMNNIVPTTLDKENIDAFIKSHDVVLLDFWAPWCPPCKAIAPIIDKIANLYQGRVGVGKVDIDAHQELREKYLITSIPTLIILKKGEKEEVLVGGQNYDAIANALDKVLKQP